MFREKLMVFVRVSYMYSCNLLLAHLADSYKFANNNIHTANNNIHTPGAPSGLVYNKLIITSN